MATTPEEKADDDQEISTGAAARLLKKSHSSIYRYVDSGDLHPSNTLPPHARRGRKKRTLSFKRSEVLWLREKLNRR